MKTQNQQLKPQDIVILLKIVSEFFFDIMIFAATRDTFFQKQLINYYKKDYPNISRSSFKVTNKNLNNKNKEDDFVIGSRGDYNFNEVFKNLIEKDLKNITFKTFFQLMGVEFAAAVSNFTTNSPLYFSHKYTPDFPVLEAVGASMSIPPAIRPLYNASDVFNYNNLPSNDKSLNSFIKNGQFKRSDYELNEYATKVALKDYLKKYVDIDLNNAIELNTFLNLIQSILIGEYKSDGSENKEKWVDKKVVVNNKEFIITKAMLAFFYNAQFKGLLIDGGYFNNIPFNYFRDKGDQLTLDNVFAIKLDRSFPPDFMDKVDTIMQKLKSKEDQIIKKIRLEEIEIDKFIPQNYTEYNEFNIEFEKAVAEIRELFGAHILNEKKSSLKKQLQEGNLSDEEKNRLKALIKNFSANRQNILKIIEEWYIQYGAYNNIKPWEIPRPIIDIAFTGYAYGSKRGQIRDITDHKYMVSLYDYGVGTYDFDLDKVRLLAEFAQGEAQYKVNLFFS